MTPSKFEGLLTNNQKARRPEIRNSETSEIQKSDKGPGRPPGKRTNPEYQQITAYIRKDTLKDARRMLLERGEQDFSELLEQLTREWVRNGGK